MKTLIKENTWLTRGFMDFGWGNGYVLIPKDSPLHGKHYDSINVDVHYGLTFSDLVDEKFVEKWPELSNDDLGCWMVGFDTAHYGDSLERWPKEFVQEEADRLMQNLKELELSYQAE